MRKSAIIGCLSLLAIGCEKMEHENIQGDTDVKGKITDIISNQPIASCKVLVYPVYYQTGGSLFGPQRTRATYPSKTLLTDSLGYYSFSVNANGQYEFDLIAEPTDPLHVSSVWTFGQDYTIKETGSHIKNLKCRRSAYARVAFKNISPIDTPYVLALYSYSNITLYNFYKDTTVYLKLIGRTDLTNDIRFSGTNKPEQKFSFIAAPWDTIPLQINY